MRPGPPQRRGRRARKADRLTLPPTTALFPLATTGITPTDRKDEKALVANDEVHGVAKWLVSPSESVTARML